MIEQRQVALAATLHCLELDGMVEEVALLAGELVTNAIAHTPASPVVLVVDWGDQVVRVEVHDGDAVGRGDGKAVWF